MSTTLIGLTDPAVDPAGWLATIPGEEPEFTTLVREWDATRWPFRTWDAPPQVPAQVEPEPAKPAPPAAEKPARTRKGKPKTPGPGAAGSAPIPVAEPPAAPGPGTTSPTDDSGDSPGSVT